MKIKKIYEYFMLNESFKSQTISKLFKANEFDNKENNNSILNQISEDEILGIVDTEEEAQKLIHDTFGDQKETRYPLHRVWHKDRFGEWDDEMEEDFSKPYVVNKTADEYMNWVIKLNSGKFLVLHVEKSKLYDRLHDIRDDRYNNRYIREPKNRISFLDRKNYVEEYKNELAEYRKFLEFLKENNIENEFFKKANEVANSWADGHMSDYDFPSHANDEDEEFGEAEFKINDFAFTLGFTAHFDGTSTYWEYPATYWDPEDSGFDIEGRMIIDEVQIYVESPEETLFDFAFLNGFDKNHYIDADKTEIYEVH